uniref:G-protein coupled receptors family 1 profile domain-containing protein n=1 Tax=Plectus sambesii TaxID=2011161 RepID=A0A914W2L9_9BILA
MSSGWSTTFRTARRAAPPAADRRLPIRRRIFHHRLLACFSSPTHPQGYRSWSGFGDGIQPRNAMVTLSNIALLIYYNRKFVFPLQFCAGVVGNALNLVVLNSTHMRTKTNLFLAALAVADLCFFVVVLPLNLTVYASAVNGTAAVESLAPSTVLFHSFLSHAHIPSLAFANWFSASSIWLSVGVTIERASVVTFPMIAKNSFTKRRITLGICLVFVLSFILSGYHFFWMKVEECRQCMMQHRFVPVRQKDDPPRYLYVHLSHILYAFFVVAIPLVALIVLNGILIHQLNLNRLEMKRFQQSSHLRGNERKATILVIVIIIAFVITNVPSGFFIVIQVVYTIRKMGAEPSPSPQWQILFAELSNSLVCTGKALNFVLYCSASSSFRKKLFQLIRRSASRGSMFEEAARKTTDISLASPINGNSTQETAAAPTHSSPSPSVRSACRYRSRTATGTTDTIHLVAPLLICQQNSPDYIQYAESTFVGEQSALISNAV